MKFGVIGISHLEASIEKREAASFRDTQKLQLYDQLLELQIQQAMIVTTCNRSELYVIYEQEEQLRSCISAFVQLSERLRAEDLFVKKEKEALCHLFEVCGGYHSMIPGEDQIVGQMKQAYEFAQGAGACGKELHRLMQKCFACIKQIKRTYHISEISTSVGYLAYQYLRAHRTLANTEVMLIGSGEMAQLMCTYLHHQVKQLYVCSRQEAHAKALSKQGIPITVVSFEQRYEVAQRCDVILSATSSPHVILTKAQYPRHTKKQILIDLASPRDIEETLQSPNRTLLNLDDLQGMVDEHAKIRKARMDKAYPILLGTVEEVNREFQREVLDHAICSLQTRSMIQAEHTFALLRRKLHLAPHEERILQKVLEASFLRMVKEPILTLKQLEISDQVAYAKMVETLFEEEDLDAISHRNKRK